MSKQQFNPLANFRSTEPEMNIIRETGKFNMRLVRFEYPLDSFKNFDGSPKTWENRPKPAYTNPTSQVGMVFVSTEGKGVFTHRQAGQSFRKYPDLTSKEIKSGKYQNIDGYACYTDKDGSLVREHNELGTEQALGILSGIMGALGCPSGSGLDALNDAIENKRVCRVTIGSEIYDGEMQYKATKFQKANSQPEMAESASSKDLDTDF